MKAQEFIKQYGWGEARTCLTYCSKRGDYIYYKNIEVNFQDLKQLVDAWELVQSWGGINDSKVAVSVSRHKKYLERAIELVESVDA